MPIEPFAGPRWILTPAAISAVDRAAIEAGLTGLALMESAGRSVAAVVRACWPSAGRAVVLVGGGNNGGDGLVTARYLANAGWRVELALFVDPARFEGDPAAQWRLLEPLGLPCRRVATPAEGADAARAAAGATCAIDALLGTGLKGEVREPIRSVLRTLNDSSAEVVAVDAPSGLDGATGQVRGVAARARLTVTLGFPKPGLFLADGPEHVGRLTVAPLGYPAAACAAAGSEPLVWSALAEAEAALPPRRHDTHKGDAGRLLIIAGSMQYRGAAVLAATAALRSGAGICVVATPATIAEFLAARVPEALVVPLPVTRSGGLAVGAADRVARTAEEANAVALGPGLTTEPGVGRLVRAALAASRPTVVDADGLNVLADDPAPVVRDAPTVLTPHPGELGRWLGRPAGEVDADRLACAREAAKQWRAHVVLKGSPTVVADPAGRMALNLTGNPALAVGGSGDVLTGLLGSLLAQGVEPSLACRAAALLHGLAADWASLDLGERGFVPSDLFRYLPLTIREVSAGRGQALVARLDHRYGSLLAATEEST